MGGPDKKFEGYSNLKGAHDQQQKKIQKNAQSEMTKGLEEEYILNLQKQIVLMEHEIKLLKDREVDQKNKASGYETLLRDGIPLNEHFLALKNKFNNEQDILKKNAEIMEEEIKKEEEIKMSVWGSGFGASGLFGSAPLDTCSRCVARA